MNVTPLHSEWLPTAEAAARLGIHRRTLQRRARAGHIRCEKRDGATFYQVPAVAPAPQANATPATVARHPDATWHATADATPNATPAATPDAGTPDATILAIIARLEEGRADAERRAAVAEYRAEIAETDPAVVEALREELDQLRKALEERDQTIAAVTEERDEARQHAQRLADAMIKRAGIIRRLTQRLKG